MKRLYGLTVWTALFLCSIGQLSAQESTPVTTEAGDPVKGAVTSLPLPRYVSLKSANGNVRRGPSLEHRIDWVFRHKNLPLRVTAEFEHWRRVEDSEGQGGWIYYTMISGARTVVVIEPKTELHSAPDAKSSIVALAEQGVIAKLGACQPKWCNLSVDGTEAWVEKTSIWGVDPDETRE